MFKHHITISARVSSPFIFHVTWHPPSRCRPAQLQLTLLGGAPAVLTSLFVLVVHPINLRCVCLWMLTPPLGASHLGVPRLVAVIALVSWSAVIGLKIELDLQHVLFNRQSVKGRIAWDFSM